MIRAADAFRDSAAADEMRQLRAAAEDELALLTPDVAPEADLPDPVPTATTQTAAPPPEETPAAPIAASAPSVAAASPSAAADVAATAWTQPWRPTPPRPLTPPEPMQPLRDIAVIRADLDAVMSELDEPLPAGDVGLLMLKSLACRERRAFRELELHGASRDEARDVYGAVKEAADRDYPEPYVIGLDTNVHPADPAHWGELAGAYRQVIPAFQAFEWFCAHSDELAEYEQLQLLEAIGAAQQRLFRVLSRRFRGGRDDQQRQIFARLRDALEDLDMFIRSIGPDVDDEELRRLAEDLPYVFQSIRAAYQARAARTTAMEAVQALLASPDFGAGEADAEALQNAAAACLAAGVLPSNRELRDALLEWESLLESDERLTRLLEEIGKEGERRHQREIDAAAAEDEDGDSLDLTPDLEAKLAQLLPYTAGKTLLIVGGQRRMEHAQKITDALQLAGVEWPETDDTMASPSFYEAGVRNCDIVVLLVRFMRKGLKGVTDLCKQYDKAFVRLPRGLGTTRVITDFHNQLVPKSG